MPNLKNSLNYEPVELAFGTSGLRGLVRDMTDLECYINASAFLNYLSEDDLAAGSTIFIAGDLRDSTPRIMSVIVKAVKDGGFKSVYCGLIPTPALAYYALYRQGPCVMVTGSHIPADRNGIKFYKRDGEVLKEDETAIKRQVTLTRERLYRSDSEISGFAPDGSLRHPPELPPIDPEAAKIYLERYTNIPNRPLAGKQIVVYQHSSVGRDMLGDILESLGAEVAAVGRSDVFIPIDTENVTSENKDYFQSLAQEYPENFAIVSTDGDSDRPFMIDETGEFHRGDVLGCLVASELGADFAAVPISANDAVDTYCIDNNMKLVHTKIGSPYVVSAMQVSGPNFRKVVGWEVNGGFLTGTDIEFMGTKLSYLPTRDAFLPLLMVLIMAASKETPISAIFAQLPKRYTGGGLIDNVPSEKILRFKEIAEDSEKMLHIVKQAFQDTDLAAVDKIDLTDGLRMVFQNGEVIHLRPSGNAPQFRVYTNASSQVQADALSGKAIARDGYIERLLKNLSS